jgi:hypothetical protein
MAPRSKRSYKEALLGTHGEVAEDEALLYLFERRFDLSSAAADGELATRWPQLASQQRAALICDVLGPSAANRPGPDKADRSTDFMFMHYALPTAVGRLEMQHAKPSKEKPCLRR